MSGRGAVEVVVADITTLEVDAIVNATDPGFSGGGGVDKAIHRAAGIGLKRECRNSKGCATGEAKVTGGHDLRAKWVIHTVGPIWRGGEDGEADALAACYASSLEAARSLGCRSVAFPAISSGIYGYPAKAAAMVAVGSVRLNGYGIDRIVLCCFSKASAAAHRRAIERLRERG